MPPAGAVGGGAGVGAGGPVSPPAAYELAVTAAIATIRTVCKKLVFCTLIIPTDSLELAPHTADAGHVKPHLESNCVQLQA